MKHPKRMLSAPTLNWIQRLRFGRRIAEKTKGRLMMTVIIPMPSKEPMPKTRMYAIPARGDCMEARTRRARAALPAKPWTVPTK